LNTGAASCRATITPTNMPTTPQIKVIKVNLRTMESS
jgi:hypothetical protein